VETQTSIRDYLTGEKVIQTFFLAYLNVSDFYMAYTEKEFGKGFVDLYLEPFFIKYDDIPHAYLIELKYIKQSEFSKELLQEKIAQAKTQLQQYATAPSMIKGIKGANLTCGILVFNGWELVYCEDT